MSPVFSRKPRTVSTILSGFNRLLTELKDVVTTQEKIVADADLKIAQQEQVKFEARTEIDQATNAINQIGKIVGVTGE